MLNRKFSKPQSVIAYEAFDLPKSMRMVEIQTGVIRSNITYFIDDWREVNRIYYAGKGRCEITRRIVDFYSNDPKHGVDECSNQLSIKWG